MVFTFLKYSAKHKQLTNRNAPHMSQIFVQTDSLKCNSNSCSDVSSTSPVTTSPNNASFSFTSSCAAENNDIASSELSLPLSLPLSVGLGVGFIDGFIVGIIVGLLVAANVANTFTSHMSSPLAAPSKPSIVIPYVPELSPFATIRSCIGLPGHGDASVATVEPVESLKMRDVLN